MRQNNKISNENRQIVIDAYLNETKPKDISNVMNIKLSTIYQIINLYKKTNRIKKDYSKNRKKKN